MMLFVFSILLIVSLFSLKFASRFNIPVLIVFLLVGIVAGSDILNIIYFDNMELTKQVANIALIFIIFESGFQLKKDQVKNILAPSLILATAGVLATAFIIGIFVHMVLKLDLLYSMLIGSIISSTDASAVINALRSSPVSRRVGDTLEFESAANDPAAIILTVFFIQFIKAGTGASAGFLLMNLIWQLSGGIIIGVLCSYAGVFLFKKLKPDNRGYYYILMIGLCLFTYGFADIIRANGIISVFFCGIFMGNSRFSYKTGVMGFLGGISAFANIVIYLLLGLLVFPKQLPAVWQESLIIALFTIFIARAVVVFSVAPFFRYKFREMLFLCFGGIKGVVPIVLSTYPSAYGLDENKMIFDTVFFIVLISLLVQGVLMKPVAKYLKLNVPPEKRPEHSFELLSMNDSEADIYEFKAGSITGYIDKELKDLKFPEGVSVTAVIRDGKIIIPNGATRIISGDILYILATEEQYSRITTKS